MSDLYPPLANTIVTIGNVPTPAMALWMQQITSAVGGGAGSVTHTGTLTAHQVLLGNGGVDIKALGALGTSGFVLTSNGAGADPSWQAASSGSVTHTGTLTAHQIILGNGSADVLALGSVGIAGQFLTSNGAGVNPSWQTGGTGDVTHTGNLTLHQLVIGNASADVKILGSPGTTSTVLHGNASGDPAFSKVDLGSEVLGILPVVNGGTGVSSAFVPLLKASTTLTDAQIKALPTTPIVLITAPGAGFRLHLLAFSLNLDATAGAYTNLDASYVDFHAAIGTDYVAYGPVDDPTATALTGMTALFGTAAHQLYDVIVPPAGSPNTAGIIQYVQTAANYVYAQQNNSGLGFSIDNNGTGNLTGGNAANSLKVTAYYVVEAL